MFTTISVKHGGGSVIAWVWRGSGSLVFIDDVTAYGSRMNTEVYSTILSLTFSC